MYRRIQSDGDTMSLPVGWCFLGSRKTHAFEEDIA
jgi:hypothetical protein